MPKRHRQPEPIDIESAAHHRGSQGHCGSELRSSDSNFKISTIHRASSAAATSDTAAAAQHGKPVYSPGEIQLANATRKKAKDFPATPESLVRRRRQLEAHAKRRRISFDKDGQPVNYDDGPGEATLSAQQRRPVPVPGTVSFPSLPGRTYSPASDGFGPASHDDGEDADADIDLSSNDYVGDDGNQPSSDDSVLGGGSEGDSAAEEEEVELRQLRRAVAAADAQRRQKIGVTDEDSIDEGDGSDEEDESLKESSPMRSSNDNSGDSYDTDEEDASESDMSDLDRESDSHEGSDEEGKDAGDAWGTRRHGGATGRGSGEYDDDDDCGDGLVTVDFGVFDMEESNIDGLLHLMDQLCPDKVNEVDRDELGLALYESPFTSVVRLQNNGEDASGHEEQEFYGLSSVLDIAHGQTLYPAALRPLCEILQRCVWRQAASGIPPTDILTSVVDGGCVASSRAKCLLLISEYIRNIPLELTMQILEDLLDRLDAAGQLEKRSTAQTAEEAMATHKHPIFATHPSMFAVLAKVQRATDAPVTLPKHTAPPASGGGAEVAGGDGDAAATTHRKRRNVGGRTVKKRNEPVGGSGSGRAMSAPEPQLNLTHYIFWREEDSILYEFRDKRVATLVYRCRPQYDGQPEHEIPLSILFVLQYGGARQAMDEMRRRQTVSAAVERYGGG